MSKRSEPTSRGVPARAAERSAGMKDVTVSADGSRVGYLHSGELRVCQVPTGQTQTLGSDVDQFGMSRTGEIVAWTSGGKLHTNSGSGEIDHVGTAKPDPTGRRIGYAVEGTIKVDGVLLAGEPDGVQWGATDPYAAYFGREDGWWWAPDGESILSTRIQGDQVTLHLLDLDGGWVDVHWDREIYPYLGAVRWADGSPLITVLRRSQAHGLVLAVDRRTGETQVHAELADPRWVNPVEGTPRHLADGRVLVGGEIAQDGYDARCLFADGTLLTPPGLYVRRVVGRLGPGAAGGELGDLLVEASENEPAEQHLFRVRGASTAGVQVHRLTSAPGWHMAECGGDTIVAGFRSLETGQTQWTVHSGGRSIPLLDVQEPTLRPNLDRVTDRKLPAAVAYPQGHVFGRRLPVVLCQPQSPAGQQVRADPEAFDVARPWLEAGYAVVMVDGRGTTGVAPSFEKVTHRRVADLALADQIEGLRALADKHSDLDLSRVVAVGEEYGGWLAAMLATMRADVVRAAVAINPWNWNTLTIPLAERYLGPHELESEVYARHELPDVPSSVLIMSRADQHRALNHLRTQLLI